MAAAAVDRVSAATSGGGEKTVARLKIPILGRWANTATPVVPGPGTKPGAPYGNSFSKFC